jgi:hypothetical protein
MHDPMYAIGQHVIWKRQGTQSTYDCEILTRFWETQRYKVRILRHSWYGESANLVGKIRIVHHASVRGVEDDHE